MQNQIHIDIFRTTLGATLIGLCACVSEVTFDENADILCLTDTDCPEGWSCKSGDTDEAQCVQTTGENADITPPGLFGDPIINPSLGKDGTTFTVCFSADEPVSQDPVVLVDTGFGITNLTRMDSVPDICGGQEWAFSLTADQSRNAPGNRALTANLLDASLNRADGIAIGSFDLDYTPPLLVGGVELTPVFGNTQTPFTTSFSLSEEVQETSLRVWMTQDEAEIDWAQTDPVDGYAFSYTYTAGSSPAAGSYNVFVQAEDRAGNLSDPMYLGSIELDFQGPSASLSVSPSTAGDHVFSVGDVIVATVTTDEPLISSPDELTLEVDPGSVAVGIATTPDFGIPQISGTQILFSAAILPQDCQGTDSTWSLSFGAGEDASGNMVMGTEEIDAFRIDCLAPALTFACIYPAGSNPGDVCPDESIERRYKKTEEVWISFTLSEEGKVDVYLDNELLTGCEQDGLHVDCRRAIQEGEEGSWDVTVSVTDSLGNSSETLLGSVEYDGVDPTADIIVDPGPHGIGSVVLLTMGASEEVDLSMWSTGAETPLPGLDLGAGVINVSSTQVSWQLTVTEDTPSGQFAGSITLEDTFGNLSANIAIGPLAIDSQAPTISSMETSRETYSAVAPFNEVEARFTVSDPYCAELNMADGGVYDCVDSLTISASMGEQDLECTTTDGGSHTHRCYRNLSSAGTDGPVNIMITALDSAGNSNQANATVRLDFTPPSIASSQIAYRPSPSSLLTEVSALAEGNTADLAFIATEIASVRGEMADGGMEVWAECASEADRIFFDAVDSTEDVILFRYSHTLDTPLPGSALDEIEIDCPLYVASLEDEVGNRSEQILLQDEIQLDTKAPSAHDAIDLERMKHLRIPWGAEQSGGVPAQYVVGMDVNEGDDLVLPQDVLVSSQDAGLVDGTVAMVAYTSATLDQSVGLLQAGEENGPLSGTDFPEVWLAALDGAGNVSHDRVRIPAVEWVATMGQKEVGSSFENPHGWEGSTISTHALQGEIPLEMGGAGMSQIAGDGPEALGELDWRLRQNDVKPEPHPDNEKLLPAMVYDSGRGVLVLFVNGETWESRGTTWVKKADADAAGETAPSLRWYTAMAYDAHRGVTILFGGQSGLDPTFPYVFSADLNDTWEWNGSNWKKISSTDPVGDGHPPVRSGHAMAYDAARKQTVLFGGWWKFVPGGTGLPGYVRHGDTWVFDGESWKQEGLSGAGPSKRDMHAMAYDEERGVVVLFGGYTFVFGSPVQSFSDTWEWNGTAWSEVDIPENQRPSARHMAGIAYDPVGHKVTLMGGQFCVLGSPCSTLALDTWTFDGTSWTDVTPTEPTTPKPLARRGMAMAFHRELGRTVLFSGLDDTEVVQSDTWLWDGAAWEQRGTSNNDTLFQPARRASAAFAYDEAREVVVLFQGGAVEEVSGYAQGAACGNGTLANNAGVCFLLLDGPAGEGQTWEWNGSIWDLRARTTEVDGPQSNLGHAMAYDAGEEAVLLFGGSFGNPSPLLAQKLNALWAWDGEDWTDISPASPNPAPRCNGAIVYDKARQRAVLFGGFAGAILGNNDLWEWDGAAWANIPEHTFPQEWPATRSMHTMVYDPQRGRTLVIGGTGYYVSPDLYEWDGTNWTSIDFEYTSRIGFAMSYDPHNEQVLGFGGTYFQNGTYWHGGLRFWKEDGPATLEKWELFFAEPPVGFESPSARANHAMVYDGARQETILLGGTDASGPRGDTWALGLAPPAHQMAARFFPSVGNDILDCWPTEDCPIEEVSLQATAGGSSGFSSSGARLQKWSVFGWETVDENDAAMEGPAKLNYSTSDAAEIGQMIFGFEQADRAIHLRTQPAHPLDPDGGQLEIRTDYIEVRVRYRHPDPVPPAGAADGGIIDGGAVGPDGGL
jgi:hypothetical protein